ncbi:hypothetical protein MF672_024270 [Actinomadura sp. ATCC 31491]|uniref:WD40 repeat domain-containing protein n=1 Tax=Actinomadura luzonensis TaxID=2805427 RepID=A0ABT0FX92_9ACTN|nr:hypothetical protein [Actinomadura luzonensis]MCK2216884.1 hypothetical protein [Actinomadura luzonensis]
MRHPSAAAALLAAAVIGGAGLATAPAAAARTGQAPVRAAWLASCPDKKHDTVVPCGHWRLLLRDGRQTTVRDAAIGQIDGSGGEIRDLTTFTVSADGRVVAYERARDHRLMVRRVGGPAKALPAGLRPKGVGTDDLKIELSPTGDKLLIDYTDEPARLPTKVVTVATGKVVELPAGDDALGFSGDGDEVLTARYRSDHTTALYARPLGGAPTSGTPPQVVANAPAHALAPDGRTVASVTTGDAAAKRPSRVRLYDLDSGDLSAAVDLPLTRGETPYALWYAADGTLHVLTQRGDEGEPAVIRVLTADPLSGDVRQSDRYSISERAYAYYAAGE